MESANVVIIEDLPNIREPMRALLAYAGHSVSCEAETLDDALTTIDAIAEGDIPCDVIVLDGNLGPNQKENSDAGTIIEAIRERNLGIKTIGFSGTSMARCGLEVDRDIIKPNISTVVAAISEL